MNLSDTTIFNNLLKALDTGMTVYIKYDNDGEFIYALLANFRYILSNDIPTILIHFFDLADTYNVIPSEGYSDSDLYIPINFTIQEVVSTPSSPK